jgi:hypothetical protein
MYILIWTTFFRGISFEKNGLGCTFGHFCTNSSGHPDYICRSGVACFELYVQRKKVTLRPEHHSGLSSCKTENNGTRTKQLIVMPVSAMPEKASPNFFP